MMDVDSAQLPTYEQLIPPVLNVLKREEGGLSNDEIERRIINELSLQDLDVDQKQESEPSSQSDLSNRLSWARTYLKKGGYISNPERGRWEVTDEGKKKTWTDLSEVKNYTKTIRSESYGAPEDESGEDSYAREKWAVLVEKAQSNESSVLVVSVRELLDIFGYKRRGKNVLSAISEAMERSGLYAWPSIEVVHIDADVELRQNEQPDEEVDGLSTDDPETYVARHAPRVAQIRAASRTPDVVTPEDRIEVAVTMMLQRDYSQVPVMIGERTLKGYVDWECIASGYVFGSESGMPEKVCDIMREHVRTVPADMSLLDAVQEVEKNRFVMVLAADRKIKGPVTTFDITEHFKNVSRAFLLVGEIEEYVRLILRNVPSETLQAVRDGRDDSRTVASIHDLTFGELVICLRREDVWSSLRLKLDQRMFSKQLDDVRQVRNRVMHFSPDPIEEEEEDLLRNTCSFLKKIINR